MRLSVASVLAILGGLLLGMGGPSPSPNTAFAQDVGPSGCVALCGGGSSTSTGGGLLQGPPSYESGADDAEARDLEEAALDANDEAVEAYERGDFAAAVALLEEALEYTPDAEYIAANLDKARQAMRAAASRPSVSPRPNLFVDLRTLMQSALGMRPDTAELRRCLASVEPPTASYVRLHPACGAIATTLYTNIKRKLESCGAGGASCGVISLRDFARMEYEDFFDAAGRIPNSPDWPLDPVDGQECVLPSAVRNDVASCIWGGG